MGLVDSQFEATVDSVSYSASISAVGISFVSKGKSSQIVRWPYVAGVENAVSSAHGGTVPFMFCLMEKVSTLASSSDAPATPVKPSDPNQFSVPKMPKLKIKTWNLLFDQSESAESFVSAVRERLRLLGQPTGLRFKVFVNPFSGTKKAMKVWKKVLPIFTVNQAQVGTARSRSLLASHFSSLSLCDV